MRFTSRCKKGWARSPTSSITSIRATTPMYLLMRKVRTMGIKMILSGEGADEIFGGYLYFHKAPNGRELHDETVRKLQKLHLYDCARANKACMAWGVEARVPFLDREFLDVAMMLDPNDTATPEIYPLSLHDALPISNCTSRRYANFRSGT